MKFFSAKKKIILALLISSGVFIVFFSHAFAADDLNKNLRFYLDSNYDYNGRTETLATLRKISDNAYFYIEDIYWNGLTATQKDNYLMYIEALADEFDQTIYPTLTYAFGSEWNPGIDNDPKITILLTKLDATAGGYFNERDERLQSAEPISNMREMIYLNSDQIANPLIYSLLAHEMQHLISWNQKERERGVEDDVWSNEMRSEFAPTICGYDSEYVGSNLERRVDDFLARPFGSLTEWQGDRYDYPPVNLFGHYLAEQFGDDIFQYVMQTSDTGIKSIETALASKSYNLTFNQVFNNWAITNYLNNLALYSGQFGYKNPYLKGSIFISPITYSITSENIINLSQKSKDWSPYMYRFFNKQESNAVAKDLEIEFEGNTNNGNYSVIYILDYISQSNKPTIGSIALSGQKGILEIPNFKDNVDSVTILISNQFKKTGFTNNDPVNTFVLSVATTILGDIIEPPVPPITGMAKPEDYGLKEGDLIRAEGDLDVFIINQAGYKRLFLNPVIFNMYGHLGGWSSIKTVRPQVRDAFVTSNYYKYSDSPKVYQLEVTGADTGKLYWLNITANQFLSSGAKSESIFTINKSELSWYPKGADKTAI